MKKLTAFDFNRMTPEALASHTDESVYKAAVAAKKLNSGMIKVIK